MNRDEVVREILNGLYTDGAHHKQESLETVLLLIVGPEEYDKLYRQGEWDD